MIKGVILAGGTGSRLYPSTKVVNKHLLPVYDRPMIYYPIDTLKRSGIQEILIVSAPEQISNFMELLGSGREFGVNFTYKVQDGSGGVAQALSLAETFAAGDDLAVILGDNIFEDSFADEVLYFSKGAQIFVKPVNDPERFGVADIDEKNLQVLSLEEKPLLPKSNKAVTGFYLYDKNVFDIIREIEPSLRGELEITDVNKAYLDKGLLKSSYVNGTWIDAGTHESLIQASQLAQHAFDPSQLAEQKQSQKTANQTAPSVTIGLLTFNSESYIESCLDSLLAQDYDQISIEVFDNHSTDKTIDLIRDKYPQISLVESNTNLGFAKGHNQIIRKTQSDYYLCVNVDMVFEPNFVSELVKAMSEKPLYGSVGGKIKHWDYAAWQKGHTHSQDAGKTNFIDSAGMRILPSHRFEDIGQSEADYGQYDQAQDIFGVSGAAVLYRYKALQDIAFVNAAGEKEFFDEQMFMYKEDIDLAYRLQWAGWKCRYSPKAVCFHDRTIAAPKRTNLGIFQNRVRKPRRINQLSFLNHQILLQKNYSPAFSFRTKRATWWYNFKVFVYLFCCEQETLFQWWKLWRMRKRIRTQRETMPRRISQAEMEQLITS